MSPRRRPVPPTAFDSMAHMADAPTERTRVRRHPERGAYERETIDAILDEALICHLAWVTDDGAPRVIPTIHVRVGDTVYVHGSTASRTLRGIARRSRGLPRGDADRRPRPGAVDAAALHELPLGRGVRRAA